MARGLLEYLLMKRSDVSQGHQLLSFSGLAVSEVPPDCPEKGRSSHSSLIYKSSTIIFIGHKYSCQKFLSKNLCGFCTIIFKLIPNSQTPVCDFSLKQ
ncbi:hypothetical protein CEXT_57791 [Caerostris extrusa]|uniref:Uncharacterized protein n=1 Tax=Caerostris extrusa TaxID=172846 RepID=A0AAV4VGR3_CAEEX|nr:hypothetical protein CEXT_57791 [Caerostris extrusa]